jgi:hypothetical protein
MSLPTLRPKRPAILHDDVVDRCFLSGIPDRTRKGLSPLVPPNHFSRNALPFALAPRVPRPSAARTGGHQFDRELELPKRKLGDSAGRQLLKERQMARVVRIKQRKSALL